MAKKRRPARGRRGALRLYADVLGLNHLHYGLWDDDSFDLEGLKVAQDRFTDHLIALIGPAPKSVLDCGCGLGTTAAKLKSLGYDVEALTPDPYQKEKVEERSDVTCHLGRFQDFRPSRRYDLVLMSESCSYIPVDGQIDAVKRVAAGGQWLVADYFVFKKDKSELGKNGHELDSFLAKCEAAGMVRDYEEDITERILPTLDLARKAIDDYALPMGKALSEWLTDRHPVLFPPILKMVLFFARKPIRKAESQRILLDRDAYRKARRYAIYRFAVPADAD